MPDTQLFEILLAAVVAGIVLFRLYTVLGRRTGHEIRHPSNTAARPHLPATMWWRSPTVRR